MTPTERRRIIAAWKELLVDWHPIDSDWQTTEELIEKLAEAVAKETTRPEVWR